MSGARPKPRCPPHRGFRHVNIIDSEKNCDTRTSPATAPKSLLSRIDPPAWLEACEYRIGGLRCLLQRDLAAAIRRISGSVLSCLRSWRGLLAPGSRWTVRVARSPCSNGRAWISGTVSTPLSTRTRRAIASSTAHAIVQLARNWRTPDGWVLVARGAGEPHGREASSQEGGSEVASQEGSVGQTSSEASTSHPWIEEAGTTHRRAVDDVARRRDRGRHGT